MLLQDVIDYFESSYRFSKETKSSPSTLTYWQRVGYVPLDAQLKLEKITNGKLSASLDDYKKELEIANDKNKTIADQQAKIKELEEKLSSIEPNKI